MRHSIRNRLILTVVGLMVVPIVFLGILLGRQAYSTQRQQTLQWESGVAHRISLDISSFHNRLIEDLRTATEVYGIHTLPPGQQRVFLEALQSHNMAIWDLALLDKEGNESVRTSHSGVNNPDAFRDRSKMDEFLIPRQSGKSYFSPVRFDEITREPLMTVSLPIMNSLNEQVIGVILGEIGLKGIWDLISGVELKSGENVYITDLEGRVIAHRGPSVVLENARFKPPVNDGPHRGLDGSVSLMAVNRVRFGDQVFAVVAERKVSEAMKPAFTRVRNIIILLIGCFLIVGGIGILAVGQIVRPLRALVKVTRKIRTGKPIRQAEVRGRGEISELAKAFQAVTRRLGDSLRSLESKVDELEKKKKSLEESERLHRTYFHNAVEMIFVQDLKGKLLDVNKVACDGMGYNKKELLKMKPADIAITRDTKALKEKIKKSSTGGSVIYETEQVAKDGKTIQLEVSSRFIKYAGKTAILSIARDITERKQAEEENKKLQAQLQHAQKMESIGTIATGVAHNFRNVLAAISVNNQLVQLKYKDDLHLQETVGRIDSSVKRGSQLVKDLMQFSRKKAKRRFEVLNLTDVLKGTYGIINESFDKKVDIHLDLPKFLLIVGDFSSLTQVFLNVCTNARDAMPNGGELRIEARRKQDKAEVIVSDTGCGMDKETKEKCFDPFFTTKEAGKGTGLGLSTAYGILKNHWGDIHIYSERNKGTVFKIYFPIAKVEEENKKETEPVIIHGDGQKVLVVDDEEEMLKPMEDLLDRLGYIVSSAEDAEVAITKYKSWKPDVVLMDRNMPKMDGVTCAKKIVKEDPAAKVVLISGYDKKGPNGIDLKTGKFIKGYITKPADVVELSHVLARILNIK